MKRILLGALALLTGMAVQAAEDAPADGAPLHPASYRHAGWAAARGGQGGPLLRVTTLAADGPGSLKAALDTRGPRRIVFEVGGIIDLGGRHWQLREPFVTIAGQTAPDPGITLVRGDLRGLVRARRLSRATLRNIRQNLFFAFVYNALGVPLAAGVLYPVVGLLLNPMIASAAMTFSSVSVIANALRLRHAAL